MNEAKLIKLEQKPVISHQLTKIGANVTKRLADLNLEKQIVSDDTIKTLKSLRASLNKELATYEGERKSIKSEVENPYKEFDAVYKTEISDKYKAADETLKTNIGQFETKLKDEKLNNIKSYFNELIKSEGIDFVPFESVGIEINLSTTEKKYKEKCNSFIEKVKDDLALIETQEYKVEILVAYKADLNATKAIKTVQDRKELEAQELEREKQKEYLRRSKLLINSEMKADAETESYVYNDEIYVSWESVKDIEKEAFQSKLIAFEEKIKAHKIEITIEEVLPETKAVNKTVSAPIKQQEPVKDTEPIKAAEVLKAPEVTEVLETVSAKFEVSGTLPELKKLGQYMKDNNLTYKNIK